jgi:PTS system ascorbate-specific IIB component
MSSTTLNPPRRSEQSSTAETPCPSLVNHHQRKEKRMNILCVCGNGIGTSVLLKINVEQVAADMDLDVNVTTSDAGSAKGTANQSDLVLTSPQLAAELEGVDVPVETIENFMDQQEVKDVLEKYVD